MSRNSAKTETNPNPFADGLNRVFEGMDTAAMDVPQAARDFVRNQATTAHERVEELHTQAVRATDGGEKLATALSDGCLTLTLTRGLFDMARANARHYLEAIEKLADAKNVGEVTRIQTDYLRESASSNMERLRAASHQTRDFVAERAAELRTEATPKAA